MDLAHFRREYTRHGLDRPDLAADPLVQFQKWFEQAHAAGLLEPNAMSLSTVGANGRPSTRTVLLK
ncbi:MAG: pyridoxamine 5'-phosphate oxidase family protein, partial [Opitutales bacterium]